MSYPRLAVLGAAAVVLSGSLHAAAPAASSLAAAPVPSAIVHADAVQLAVNTYDATAPLARAAAPQRRGSSDAAPSYVQDVGTSWSRSATAPQLADAAPLPGALWLFGSALLAFLAISVRRKF